MTTAFIFLIMVGLGCAILYQGEMEYRRKSKKVLTVLSGKFGSRRLAGRMILEKIELDDDLILIKLERDGYIWGESRDEKFSAYVSVRARTYKITLKGRDFLEMILNEEKK